MERVCFDVSQDSIVFLAALFRFSGTHRISSYSGISKTSMEIPVLYWIYIHCGSPHAAHFILQQREWAQQHIPVSSGYILHKTPHKSSSKSIQMPNNSHKTLLNSIDKNPLKSQNKNHRIHCFSLAFLHASLRRLRHPRLRCNGVASLTFSPSWESLEFANNIMVNYKVNDGL